MFIAAFLTLVLLVGGFSDRSFVQRFLIGEDRALFRMWIVGLFVCLCVWPFISARLRKPPSGE